MAGTQCLGSLLTNKWNWLGSPADDAVLVAPLHVQMHVLLFGCSTVSQRLNPQRVAFAHSVPDSPLDGQTRVLAHSLPVHVTRHVAAWTNSDLVNLETWIDDCDHFSNGWERLTDQALSRLEVPLENCDGSQNQAQEDGEGDVTGGSVGINAEVVSSSS